MNKVQTKIKYVPVTYQNKEIKIKLIPSITLLVGFFILSICCGKALFSTHSVVKEAVPYKVVERDTIIIEKPDPLSKRIVRDFTKSYKNSPIENKNKTIAINQIIANENVLEFLTHNEVLQRVVRISEVTGLKPSVIIAQKGLESNWGKSYFTQTTKCLGNIKCNNKACKKFNKKGLRHKQIGHIGQHCVQLYDDNPSDRFVRFKTYQEGWNHYQQLIEKRYMSAGTKKTANAQISKIRALGYATDKKYASKVSGIISKNKLNKLDEYILKGYTITSMTGKYVYLNQ